MWFPRPLLEAAATRVGGGGLLGWGFEGGRGVHKAGRAEPGSASGEAASVGWSDDEVGKWPWPRGARRGWWCGYRWISSSVDWA